MAKHHSKRDRPAKQGPTRSQGRRSKSTSDLRRYQWACGKCEKNPLGGFSHRSFPSDVAAMAAGKVHKQRHHRDTDVLIMVAPEAKKAASVGNGPFVGSCGACTFATGPTSDYNEAADLAQEHRWVVHGDADVLTSVASSV